MSIAVVILTYNEELHLARALRSVAPLTKEVYVIDSFSTDDTVKIARSHGVDVRQRAFDNQARQFNWALDTLTIRSDWILRLDADEVIEPDLAAEIAARLPGMERDVVGVNLKRKHIFMNRWIRHGGRYPLELLRIWRRGYGRVEDRWMDEHVVVKGGRTVTFDGGFSDHNLNDLTFFTDKHNKYATREAIEVLNQRLHFMTQEAELSTANSSRQAALKRALKERIYNRIPFQFSALSYFLYRYLLQVGFLDGKEGLIYHGLQGFWYRFLVGAKIEELSRAVSDLREPADIRAQLSRLTGLKLG
ncbi:glycosyltransferase family 2 protein [Bradyrhizobium ottawaense]|uniref:glycosyltransferase family 2 protein n=1 Tax=Bradyrhizobium ottawaense TaxID=931866 RepID=UPI001BA4DE54|nr:glycosyltransferase family 2 protein [Bradyrhizobium ottawaense]MBR1292473.1 glycosyltransferase family 2 protein [Bradyrhizobium ottawaense]